MTHLQLSMSKSWRLAHQDFPPDSSHSLRSFLCFWNALLALSFKFLSFTIVSFQDLCGSFSVFLGPYLNVFLIHWHILEVCWAHISAVAAKACIWEEHSLLHATDYLFHWGKLCFVPEGLLLHQRVRSKQHTRILEESVKNSTEIIQVSLSKAPASWQWGGEVACSL